MFKTPKQNILPFHADNIFVSKWGFGLCCLTAYNILWHSSRICSIFSTLSLKWSAVFSIDSVTINTFLFFSSSWGSYNNTQILDKIYEVLIKSPSTKLVILGCPVVLTDKNQAEKILPPPPKKKLYLVRIHHCQAHILLVLIKTDWQVDVSLQF